MDEKEYAFRKNKFLKEFILLYKNLPCLWDNKSKEYHVKELRNKAYKELAKKLRLIDPSADRMAVVKKINSLRSCLRKEHNKVADFAKQGVEYTPRLWYYSLFDFIRKDGNSGGSRDDEEEESAEPSVKQEDTQYEIDFEYDDPLDSYDTSYKDESSKDNSSPLPKKAKKSQPEFARASSSFPESGSGILHDDSKNISREDQYDVFGKNVTVKLRTIAAKDNTQRLMAEKIINDALFMAELGKLEMEHCSKLHAE